MRLEVAGILIDLHYDYSISAFDRFNNFISNSDQNPELNIYLNPVEVISKPRGNIYLDDVNKWIRIDKESFGVTVFKCSLRDPDNEPIYRIDIEDNWTDATVTFLKGNKNVEEEVAILIGYILFKNNLIFHEGLIIHASAVVWNGQGILFSAPSGTGKSTQAKLWSRYMNASILNDDSPAVRVIDDQGIVFGTPWGGSEKIGHNSFAPISALIIIEQSDKNVIRKLRSVEVVPMLLPRCFLPYHDEVLMEKACLNLERIIQATPCYHLQCAPDKESIEITSRCISQ